jgi:hypothetical protein
MSRDQVDGAATFYSRFRFQAPGRHRIQVCRGTACHVNGSVLVMESALRTAHGNESIRRLYETFLGEPLGEVSHRYLHTHYAPREVVR